jgi:hypothetical protein
VIKTLTKPGKDAKLTTDKPPIFEKVILKMAQRHTENSNILNACQFGFRARHSTTLQCMRLTDQVTLNFNNNMATAAVFLDIEKAFDTTWHPSMICKLSKLHFLSSLIKLPSSFLSSRKFRDMTLNCPHLHLYEQGCHKVPFCPTTLYSLYINHTPQTPGVHLALFVDDTCIYTTDCKKDYVLRNLQRSLTSKESWCEPWKIKTNEDKTQTICSPIYEDTSRFILHQKDGTFLL